jgi:hypothetical protein
LFSFLFSVINEKREWGVCIQRSITSFVFYFPLSKYKFTFLKAVCFAVRSIGRNIYIFIYIYRQEYIYLFIYIRQEYIYIYLYIYIPAVRNTHLCCHYKEYFILIHINVGNTTEIFFTSYIDGLKQIMYFHWL